MPALIKFDETDLDTAKFMLNDFPGGIKRASARAINDTLTGVRTDMVSLIRDKYNHKATAIRSRISIVNARVDNLAGHTQSKGRAMNLIDISGATQTKKGISVAVKKGAKKLLPSAFINKGRTSGKQLVFQRVMLGGHPVWRYDIKALPAPSPELIYNTPENWATLQANANARLDKNFAKEVNAIIQGYRK